MNISKVNNVSFGNVYLSKDIKESIVKNRTTPLFIDDVKSDNQYRKKTEILQKMLKTGNKGKHELTIESVEVGGEHDDGYRWTDGGYVLQEEPVNEPGIMHYYLHLDGMKVCEITESYDGTNTLDVILKALKRVDIKKAEKKVIKRNEAERSEELKEKADRKRLQENDKFFKEFLA